MVINLFVLESMIIWFCDLITCLIFIKDFYKRFYERGFLIITIENFMLV